MEKFKKLAIAIGLSAFAIGGFSLANGIKSTVETKAASVTDPSGAFQTMYVSLTGAWQTNATSYNYFLEFIDSTTGNSGFSFLGWANKSGNTNNYCLAAVSPDPGTGKTWNRVTFYRTPLTVTNPNNITTETYSKSTTGQFVTTTTSGSSTTTTKYNAITMSAATAANILTGAENLNPLSLSSWTANYPNQDAVNAWCGEFMARTAGICASSSSNNASSFASAWSAINTSWTTWASTKNTAVTSATYRFTTCVATSGTFTPDGTSNYMQYAANRYEYLVSKYNLSNATINRTLTGAKAAQTLSVTTQQDQSGYVFIGVLGVLALASSVGYVFLKKKSE